MISQQLLRTKVIELLEQLKFQNMEKTLKAASVPQLYFQRNQQRQLIFSTLDSLAKWHTHLTVPHCGAPHCGHMLALISLLPEGVYWYDNSLVMLWYLRYCSSRVAKENMESELSRLLVELSEDDLLKLEEPRGANQEYPVKNMCARIILVAPLIEPDLVQQVLASHHLSESR